MKKLKDSLKQFFVSSKFDFKIICKCVENEKYFQEL